MYIIYQEYELKSVPYKRKLFDLYVFQKSPYSMLLWRYSKICNSTQIQIGQFIHLTSLFYRQWTKCIVLYANAVVQPSVQHYSCFMAWKSKVHTWCRNCHFCINAPMWREKRWLQGIFDPPSYIILFQTIHYSPVHLVESVGYCGLCTWGSVLHESVMPMSCIANLLLRARFVMMPAPSIKLWAIAGYRLLHSHAQVIISYWLAKVNSQEYNRRRIKFIIFYLNVYCILQQSGIPLKSRDIDRLIEMLDKDGDGEIDYR